MSPQQFSRTSESLPQPGRDCAPDTPTRLDVLPWSAPTFRAWHLLVTTFEGLEDIGGQGQTHSSRPLPGVRWVSPTWSNCPGVFLCHSDLGVSSGRPGTPCLPETLAAPHDRHWSRSCEQDRTWGGGGPLLLVGILLGRGWVTARAGRMGFRGRAPNGGRGAMGGARGPSSGLKRWPPPFASL